MARALQQRPHHQAGERGPEEARLEPRGARQLGDGLVAHVRAVRAAPGRRSSARRRSTGPTRARRRCPSRVIGSTSPAASPTSAQRGPAGSSASKSRALSDGIGHEYGSSVAPSAMPRRAIQSPRPRAQRAGGDPGVRLRADADGEVAGPRKRPDVAGRIGGQLDHDFVAGDAVREEAGGDRQLIAAERRRDARRRTRLFAPSAPMTNDARWRPRVGRRRVTPRVSTRDVRHARPHERGAGPLGGGQQRRVEARAAGDDERARRRAAPTASTRAASPLRQKRADRIAVRGNDAAIDRVGDERQRASGDAAAARLLARMRPVEDRRRARRARASTNAARAPAGPAPTMATSRTSHRRTPHVDRTRVHPARRTPVIHYTPMIEVEAGRFTVGVFQDVAWAAKGIDALEAGGLAARVADDSREGERRTRPRCSRSRSARPASRLDIAGVGPVVAARAAWSRRCRASARDLAKLGLAGTMRRVGFQAHDGRIFEALVGPRRRPRRHPQRAARRRRAGHPVLVRRRQRRDWRLDRTSLETVRPSVRPPVSS